MSDALFLEVLGDGDVPRAELPRQGRLIVGSSADRASYVVTGQGVADVHCTIARLKGGGWAVKDMGSDFGTLLNGERIETARLNEGDVLLLGSRKIQVVSTAAAPEPAPAPAPKPKPEPRPRSTKRDAGALPTVAGYRVDRELGVGAMGHVFLATQESLDRRVALKILKPKLASDDTFVRRFRDEARAAARLNHPNIVTVYDVGESDAHHFLSMEFMAGGSIEVRLAELGPLPWREALDVVRDAAAGLVYAESRGIVHRDIKPENLMRNQDGVTKIADLGLAVQVEQESVDAAGGKVFGTPHFVAPEIARGQPADARSDLYSLGVTAYRILSGQTPFTGASPREILRSALNDEPEKLGTLVPGLPPAFEAIVHRLLEKDPDDRHPSASILLTEVERLRTGGADAPAEGGGGSKRAMVLGVLALAIAGAGAFALLGGGGDDPDVPRDSFRAGPRDETTAVLEPPTDDTPPDDGEGEPTDDPAPDVDEPSEDPSSSGTNGATAPDGAVEFEYMAERALLRLSDEALTPEARANRLRALAKEYAGTDAARRALEEAEKLETGDVEAERVAEARGTALQSAIADLRKAANLDADPFHPGTALRAMNLVPEPASLAGDAELAAARMALVDEVLAKGLERGRAAVAAADAAEAAGDFSGTGDPLRAFLTATDLPSAEDAPQLVGEGAPESLAEFETLAATVRTRLDVLEGRRDEFADLRLSRERTAIAGRLGESLEEGLRSFSLVDASEGVRSASTLATDERVRDRLVRAADDLQSAASVVESLIAAWTQPGWRRQSVLDPRPDENGAIDVVGVAPGSLLLDEGATPTRVPLSTWFGRTRELENLFRGRLNREWTPEERRGIAALLTISATLQALETLEPALMAGGRRLPASATEKALRPFEEALEFADDDEATLVIVREQRDAVASFADGLIARQRGDWVLAAELFERLLEEQRGTWLVMLLSEGGAPR